MRAPASTIELIDLVRKSGILPGQHLDEKLSVFPNLPVDPTASAALLVKQGMLTRFQAKLLLTGRWRGFKLGSYVVREQIGQGGMGAVYLAEHETLKRQVALKVLPPAKGDQNAKLGVERFLREARAVAALDHPNIVRIHDVGHQGDVHFLVMEYVEGQTLEDLLRKGGPVTPSRAVEYIAQAAAGLQHAHEKGFIHRDIKPANLMLAKDGTVKILDMGLARSSTNESDKLTERMDEGAIVGTADFISPEQAMNAPNIDIRSDIYSLGATFFALVTGTPPFSGNTTQKLVQHQMKDAPSLTTIDRTFPPALAKVVTKMLQKKADKRYQSPGDVISAVAEWLPNAGAQRMVVSLSGTDLAHSAEMQATLSELATGGTARISQTKRLAAMQGRWPWKLYAGVGGAVVAAAILVGWMVFGGTKQEKESASISIPVAQLPPATTNTVGTVKPATVAPPKPTPIPTPAVKASIPLPSVGKVVQKLDPADLETFRAVYQSSTLREGRLGKLPPGWNIQVFRMESVGEFRVEAFDGQKVFLVGSVEGEAATQLVFRPDRANLKLFEPNKAYEVRFECKADADIGGHSSVQLIGDWKTLIASEIKGTAWRWMSHRFVMPATGDVQVTFGSRTAAPDKFVHFRKIEIVEVGSSTAGAARFALDLKGQEPFVESGKLVMGANDQKVWKVGQKTGAGKWPANWSGRPWREADESDFFVELAGDRPIIGSRNTGGKGSAMLISPEVDGLDGRCILDLEYRSDAKPTVKFGLRFLPTKPTKEKAFDLVKLDPTYGEWKSVKLELDLKNFSAGRFEFHNNDTGPGGEFRIRRMVASTVASGVRQLFKLDPGTVPAFRAVKQGYDTLEGQPGTFPRGVYMHGHKKETVAAVAREVVDGVPAFSLAHRNAVESAQLGLEFEAESNGLNLPLQSGNPYVLRFTYKTSGTASGVAYFQEFGTWNQLKVLEFPSSDSWKTVELEAKKTDGPLRAVIDLRGTGEGNTLFIREVELLEAGAKPTPAAAAVPAAKPMKEGEVANSISFGSVVPFRCTFADMKTDFDLGSALPAGVWMSCWNAASVAEFRANEVEGRTGLGITNLNDTISAQMLVQDVNKLVPGENYRVKIDYLTKNDSTGKVFVRKPKENFASFASADLPGTNGQWKTATLDFLRPAAGVDIDLLLGNASVGEGNTIYVGKIEIVKLSETEEAPLRRGVGK